MNNESKYWTRYLKRNEWKVWRQDIVDVMQRSKEDPGKHIYLSREAARKKKNYKLFKMLMHLQCLIIKGRKANVLHICWQVQQNISRWKKRYLVLVDFFNLYKIR